jgi:hypothetical protein
MSGAMAVYLVGGEEKSDSYNNDEGGTPANEDKESQRNGNALNYIGMLQLKGD